MDLGCPRWGWGPPSTSRWSGSPPRAQNIPKNIQGFVLEELTAKGTGDGHSEAAKSLSPELWPVFDQNFHIHRAKKALFGLVSNTPAKQTLLLWPSCFSAGPRELPGLGKKWDFFGVAFSFSVPMRGFPSAPLLCNCSRG